MGFGKDLETAEMKYQEDRSAEDTRFGQLVEELVMALRVDNSYRASCVVEELIKNGLGNMLDDQVMAWKFHLVGTLTVILVINRERGPLSGQLRKDKETFAQKIADAETVPELQEIYREIVRVFCRRDDKDFGSYSTLVQRVIDLTERDLTEQLTLQYFAEKLNVNSSYLSNLFRKETGVTITEYVTSKRIRLAGILLRHTQSSVRVIAKKAGIPDVQYFSRLFKKKTGLTPTQYRMNG